MAYVKSHGNEISITDIQFITEKEYTWWFYLSCSCVIGSERVYRDKSRKALEALGLPLVVCCQRKD